MENSSCHYGNQCVEAHGNDELNEWKERFEYRKMRLQRACEKELFGKSYTEQLLEKWVKQEEINDFIIFRFEMVTLIGKFIIYVRSILSVGKRTKSRQSNEREDRQCGGNVFQ